MRKHTKTKFSFKRFTAFYFCAAVLVVLVGSGTLYYEHASYQRPVWCLLFETQDWEQGYCYATCDGGASCAALDEKYRIVQDTFGNDDRKLYYDFSSIPIETPDGGFVPSSAAVYTVNTIKDGILGPLEQASSTSRYRGYNERTWDLISLILPKAAARRITEFAGYADIAGESGAYVAPTDETSHDWSVNVNYATFYTPRNTLYDRGETIHTLVHEIGHVMTLSDAFEPGSYTVDLSGNDTNLNVTCDTTQFTEGCAKAGTPLSIFAAHFWPEANGDGEQSADYSPDIFVSSYAATNAAEDMAESWTAFVLLDEPTGHSIADQKVRFFYLYPEFVEARAEILKNINKVH